MQGSDLENGANWKFDERHIVGKAIPHLDNVNGRRVGVTEGLALGYTMSIRCSGSSGIFPERYSTGNAAKDAECYLFLLFFEMCCRLKNEEVVEYFIIEEIRNKSGDKIIAHRFVVGINAYSKKYTGLMNGDDEEEDSGCDNNNNNNNYRGESAEEENVNENADLSQSCDSNYEEREQNQEQRGSVNEEMSKQDLIMMTVDGVFASLFFSTVSNQKGPKGKKSKGAQKGEKRVFKDEEKLYRYKNALKRYMIHLDDMNDEDTRNHNLTNTNDISILLGKKGRGGYSPAQFGGYKVFTLVTCINIDDMFKGDKRYSFNLNPECSEEEVYFEEFEVEQRKLTNYFETNDVLGKLEVMKGIILASCLVIQKRKGGCRVMNVSVSHLSLKARRY